MDIEWNTIPESVKSSLTTLQGLVRTEYQTKAIRTIEDYLRVHATMVVWMRELKTEVDDAGFDKSNGYISTKIDEAIAGER